MPSLSRRSKTDSETFVSKSENGGNAVTRILGSLTWQRCREVLFAFSPSQSASDSCIGALGGLPMAEEYVVSVVPDEEPEEASTLGVVGVIWNELSGGIGPWGTLRPLVALALSLVPFLYLGQHFNRQHGKGFGWFVIQLPLILSVVLWPILFIWSIADAWWVSSGIVARAQSA